MMKLKSGIVLLNKPAGKTSFDCIRELKRVWKRTDIGHGGTLDKFATGLLPIFLGEGLKLARFFLESYPALPTYWKTYEGIFKLGRSTETGDNEGAVIGEQEVGHLDKATIQTAMDSFIGAEYMQTPPLFCAKKIKGERASDLVRKGEKVDLKPVKVIVQSFNCVEYDSANNEIHFQVTCSKGAYVRSLATDLARKLNNIAFVKTLKRTAIGNFDLANATPLEELLKEENSADNFGNFILNLSEATSFLPAFELLDFEIEQSRKGRFSDIMTRLANSGAKASVYCAKDNNAVPSALLELNAQKNVILLRSFLNN